jgi:hypothetical protein
MGLRVTLLAGVVFAIIGLTASAADAVFPPPDSVLALSPSDSPTAAAAWAAIAFLYAVVLAYPIVRSRWVGWRLVSAVFIVFYTITTVLSMIEVAAFMQHVVSTVTILRILVVHAIEGAAIAPLAVWAFGRWDGDGTEAVANPRLAMPPGRWAWKLAVIAVTYVFLYILFGALVAWSNPVVRDFYAGAAMPSAGAIVTLQLFRALVWVAAAVLVICMMRGPWWESALAVALLFSVLMNAGLLAPNPCMPGPVRMTHLVETASSNFLFGWFTVWLLLRVKREEAPGRGAEVSRPETA